jgi:DNA-binding Lrp family transcriptional regulator
MNNDQQLLNLLRENSRRSVSDMAKQLGVSRTTVQQRMERLERNGTIEAYTIKLNPHSEQQQVSAYIMISVVGRKAGDVVRHLQKDPQLDMLCSISVQYDLLAKVPAATTEQLDQSIDSISTIDGVETTLSHVVLSRKVDR